MRLQIYHTNDIHSNFAFLKRVHGYLAAHAEAADFYFDSGDFTDLKNVIVQADRGMTAIGLLKACAVDAMALGNNEIDLGCEDVSQIANVPILSVNAVQNDGSPLPNLFSSLILERCGKRFLILGFSPYYSYELVPNKYNLFFEMGNIHTTEPIAAARAVLEARRGQYDYCIALSHSGHVVDGLLRKNLPEIDLWLGGHTHAVLTEKEYTMSGMGEKLGRITLEIEETGIHPVESIQIDPPECENAVFDALLAEASEKADRILSAELETAGELAFDPLAESPLTNFLCDCLRHHFGGDLAMMHAGIAEGPLVCPVSRKSLLETFPSKLNPTVYRIRGASLLEAARQSLDEEFIRQDGRGAGFRGHILGCLGYSCNVQITRQPFSMRIDGRPVEPEREYTVVTDDYLQRGTGYPSLRVPDSEATFDKWFIRDMVQHSLTEAELFRRAYIPRIVEENKNGV